MNENELLVKELIKLQILCMRWVERHTNLRCVTYRDMDRILKGGKLTITYKDAVKNLKMNIDKYCKNDYLINSVLELEENVNNSEIYNLRFGVEPQRKFTELEYKLDSFIIKRTLFMINEMVGIKYIVEDVAKELNLTESAVKQACQQERLLNTRKIGNNWMVHIPECRAYWNIPDDDETHLYKDWEY